MLDMRWFLFSRVNRNVPPNCFSCANSDSCFNETNCNFVFLFHSGVVYNNASKFPKYLCWTRICSQIRPRLGWQLKSVASSSKCWFTTRSLFTSVLTLCCYASGHNKVSLFSPAFTVFIGIKLSHVPDIFRKPFVSQTRCQLPESRWVAWIRVWFTSWMCIHYT